MLDIDMRFRMVREASVHDYVDKIPDPHEIEEFEAASEKFGLPVRAGGRFYTLWRDEPFVEKNIKTPKTSQLAGAQHADPDRSRGQTSRHE